MIARICVSIQDDLRRVEEIISLHLRSDLAILNTIIEYVTHNGGKRIRPALFLLSARLIGVTNPEVAKAAAGFELIHTASLLHDDVVDDAAIRRSKPSAKVKWGNQVSVLVGDFLWSKGCSLFVAQRSHELMNATVEAIAGLTEGVLLEISRQNDITMDEDVYIKIIRGKTAALFAACGEGAGVLADVSEPFVVALKRYGFDFGVAFQLADDALDVVTDLREGKLTFPLIEVLKHATSEETRLIRDVLIADHLTDQQFQDVLAVIKKYNAVDATIRLARTFAEKAKSHLALFKPSIDRDALMSLADYAVERGD